jgi:hypothetical protein
VRGTPVRQTDFSGGVDTKAAPYLLAKNEARDARNVVSTARGSVRKRDGNQTFVSTFAGAPATLTSLFAAQAAATVLIATGAAKIYSIGTGGVAADITGAATLTSGLRWEWVEAPASGGQGPLYGVNGTDTPKQWTGAGNVADWTATSGTVPNGRFMLYVGNRVIVAGMPGDPSAVAACAIGDPRNWSTGGGAANGWLVRLDPNDGDAITGLGTIGPYVLVFKRSKTYVIQDTETGANRRIDATTGCVAHRTITETPNGTYYLTADKGVYVTNGNWSRKLSDKIDPTLAGIVAAQRQNAAATFFNDHYYLAVCTSGTTNNLTVDYDTVNQSWWFHSNTVNQFARWRPGSGVELYAAQAAAAIVDKCYVPGVLQDNGVNFTAYWLGPWITFDQPFRRKRIRGIHVDGTGILDAYIAKDFALGETLVRGDIFSYAAATSTFGGTGTFGGDGVFGDAPAESERLLPTLGVTRAFSFKAQSTSAQPMEMDALTTFMQFRSR